MTTAEQDQQQSIDKAANADGTGLAAFRDRARQLLQRQRERIRRVEATLSEQVHLLAEEVQCERARGDQRQQDFEQRIRKLERQRDAAVESRREAEELLQEARIAISQASNDQHELRVQLSQCHKQLNARADELKELRTRLTEKSGRLAEDEAEKLAQLLAERDELRDQLASVQTAAADSKPDDQRLDELRQRFEMAVQEVRELKARNSELSDKLAEARSGAATMVEAGAGCFDWEAQKLRLVAQLESNFDSADSDQASDKLTVEGAIRITDQVVAEKEKEIAELQQLLTEQSSNLGEVAVGAAAIAEMLDQDEFILEERENLKRLQEESTEKLRQAEIDISVERAKLARERVELEGRIAALEEERALQSAGGSDSPKQKTGGRWLSRLGLKDDDD